MKYPKEWIEVVRSLCVQESDEEFAEVVLDRLSHIGALKDPPKPREWKLCPECVTGAHMQCGHDYVTVREVLDDD
jgi:hypothetical protein